MNPFTYYQPVRIHFGAGKINELGKLAVRYGDTCLLVTLPVIPAVEETIQKAKKALTDAGLRVVHFSELTANPSVTDINRGVRAAYEAEADLIIGLGGGSAIDSAKMIAMGAVNGAVDWDYCFAHYNDYREIYPSPDTGKLPVIAVTTTSGTGSQCTQAAVVTDENGMKTTVFHQEMFPQECIVDPELMLTLPWQMTACTAFDAFSHAFESYIGRRTTPVTDQMSVTAIQIIAETLPKLREENTIESRSRLAYADTLAGICLSNGGGNAPHPMGEIIGSIVSGMNHGQSLALVYPAFLKQMYSKNLERFAEAAYIFKPEYRERGPAGAAAALSDIIREFLEKIGLEVRFSDFTPTAEQQQEILNCPVWEKLPMASKDEFLAMLNECMKT